MSQFLIKKQKFKQLHINGVFLLALQISYYLNRIENSQFYKKNTMTKQLHFKVLLFLTCLTLSINATIVAFTHITQINAWWPQTALAASIGVPGSALPTQYNYISLGFWTCNLGAVYPAALWVNPTTSFGTLKFGSTDIQIRTYLKNQYSSKGIKLLVTAFENIEYPVRLNLDAKSCAQKLSTFVTTYNLDGADISFQDSYSFSSGTAQQWLTTFTNTLKGLLSSDKIIVHTTPVAHFKSQSYPKGGYVTVDKNAGSNINFYNVQFYNQGLNQYKTYSDLFKNSSSPNTKTSVNELIARGIQKNKIVVAKPATSADSLSNQGYVSSIDLGSWAQAALKDIGWGAGFCLDFYHHDTNGSNIYNALQYIFNQTLDSSNSSSQNTTGTNTTNNTNTSNYSSTSNTTNNQTNSTSNSTSTNTSNDTSSNTSSSSSNTTNQTSNTTNQTSNTTNQTSNTTNQTSNTTNQTSNTTNQTSPNSSTIQNYTFPFPIYFTYVDSLTSWWGDSMLASMGVPGYAVSNNYNYFAFSFWTYGSGPVDVALAWAQPSVYMPWLGTNKSQIQTTIKNAFNANNKKLMVSAFGSTQNPTSQGFDPTDVAVKLATFVTQNNFDGVDIDYEDNAAMEAGTAQQWLITFQFKLRSLLPNHIITHAPQAPYFKSQFYKNHAYITVNTQVGSTIDFYNIQFYNQGINSYVTYLDLFTNSLGYFSATSVKQIINRGIPAKKVVLGKPATLTDANNGYVSPSTLGSWGKQAQLQFGWVPCYMFWQYYKDTQGTIISTVINSVSNNTNTSNTSNTSTTSNTSNTSTSSNTSNTSTTSNTSNTSTSSNTSNTSAPLTPSSNTNTTNTTTYSLAYPIYFTYIDTVPAWWGDALLAGMGVPGYATSSLYNYFAFAFWTYSSGPVDVALVWAKASTYMSWLGTNTSTIQLFLKKIYNQAGKKIMVSAFGATQFPTSQGFDPTDCATKLGNFVIQNNLDGVDIDYEDNAAMEAGTAQKWLITFHTKLRSMLPNHIITHAPQAPYFKSEYYMNHGYVTVNNNVGSTIDFYNIQFYNQGPNAYTTYSDLFTNSLGYFSGTSVKQIIARGVPSKKIVVGKPATTGDANNGYINPSTLGQWCQKAKTDFGWIPSLMFWQYSRDLNGAIIKSAASGY